jgi:PIN domain nuclease of toxin-antitoxin system
MSGRRFLLDTNALLAWLADGPMVRQAAAVIADPANDVRASAVSLWEIGIKAKSGRLVVDLPLAPLVRSSFGELPITDRHVEHAGALPLHHRDPFDRLLIAQAQLDHLTVVTSDRMFERYEVDLIRC